MIALKHSQVKEIAANAEKYADILGSRAKEIAQVVGEPIDARNYFTDVVNMVSEVRTADPEEYVYYHTARIPTDRIEVVTADAVVTQRTNSLIAPTAFTFIDVASNEEIVKLTDLAKRKENIMARVNESINDGLNTKEINYVVSLLAAAATSSSQTVTLGSGVTTFQYQHVIQMLQQVNKYGDEYVLLMGTTCYQDYLLWNWTDNKNQDIFAAFRNIGIKPVQVQAWAATDEDSGSITQMTATKAYLVATRTKSAKKPILMVRRKLGDLAGLLGVTSVDGDVPERLVLQSMNPVGAGASNARTLSVALTGFEELVAACVNIYAVSEFTRA